MTILTRGHSVSFMPTILVSVCVCICIGMRVSDLVCECARAAMMTLVLGYISKLRAYLITHDLVIPIYIYI